MAHTHTPSFLSKQEGAPLTKLMSLLLAICAPSGLAPPMALTRLILSVRLLGGNVPIKTNKDPSGSRFFQFLLSSISYIPDKRVSPS